MTIENDLIKYFESLGLEIHTSTKARGHQGFFLDGRVDISKNLPQERVIPTLLHEFAHYVHSKIEKNMAKTGGSLNVLFDCEEDTDEIFNELVEVTHFVDMNSLHKKLSNHREIVKNKIKELDELIKKEYPKFQRSKKFKELEKIVKKSNAKYLLKYDRVKISGWLFQKTKIYSIDNIEYDFPELKPSVVAFIRLKSYQKKQARISQRIYKLNKYYERPTELFARFVEGLYVDETTVKELAPKTYGKFCRLLNDGYYLELKSVLDLVR